MIEMIKNKYFIILAILVIGVCYLSASDTKKTVESEARNGQKIVDLNK